MKTVLVVLVFIVCLPLIALAMPFAWLDGFWTRFQNGRVERAFRRVHEPAGRTVVIVCSRSPHSQPYIETQWLPRLGHRAIVLNWSDRHQWPRRGSVEIALYHHFAKGVDHRKLLPLVLVLLSEQQRQQAAPLKWSPGTFEAWFRVPPGRTPGVHVIRFWEAFRDYKHGRDHKLRAAEAELFALVEG